MKISIQKRTLRADGTRSLRLVYDHGYATNTLVGHQNKRKRSYETVLQEQSIHYERTNGNSEQKIEFCFHSADYQCPKYQAGMTNQDLCYITAEVFEPRRTMSPSFVNDGQESYAFESHSSISLRDT